MFYSGCVVVLGVDLVFGLINCVLKKNNNNNKEWTFKRIRERIKSFL